MAKAKRKKREDTERDQVLEGEGFTATLDPENGVLYIHVDTSRKGRPSKSGKMVLLATSSGWKKIGDVSFSFNVGRKV